VPTDSDEETKQFAVRLPVSLIQRLEKHAVRMRRASPGVDVRRSDALRQLLHEALETAEARDSSKK
jgi:hypothetical protein